MTRPIRILELRSVRGTGGGPEKTILLGAEQRDRARFVVTVCYIRDLRDDVFAVDERAGRMDIDYVEVRERHSFDRAIWRQLQVLVCEREIDIVHAHDYKTDFLALLLARRTGVIPLATAHGWAGQSARERYVYYPVDKRLLARFPRVIAVSGAVTDILMRHGAHPGRISVLLNAIDPFAFRRNSERRDSVRRELGYGSSDFVIGAVGRLERVKRFDLLIEALAPLMLEQPHLRLVIVGDGSLQRDLTSLAARFNVNGQCRFLGHRQDVGDLHQAFDLFVQSSESEGAPNAVLEAMAMETPLIATDVGGTRELATPDVHGLIIPRHDLPALRAAISAVLNDPITARTRAIAARQRVEAELSFEARTRRLETIYEDLVHNRGGRQALLAVSSTVPHA